MVGVPRSRGCLACRKQKKKCQSSDSKPPCSRCHRLNITCEGMGEQRYKFQDENTKFAASVTGDREVKGDTQTLVLLQDTKRQSSWPIYSSTAFVPSISTASDNSLDRLVARFSKIALDANADARFQLVWNFGPFLEDVPRHLGHNEAMDTAAEALISIYENFRVSKSPDLNLRIPPACIKAYVEAIQALRRTLNDPSKATSGETLSSIMMLLVLQAVGGPEIARFTGHLIGAARVLKARGYLRSKDPFEDRVLMSLRGPVIVGAFFAKSEVFTDQEWQDLVVAPSRFEGVDGDISHTFARLPRLFHKIRAAFREIDILAALSPLRKELYELYLILVPARIAVENHFLFYDTNHFDKSAMSMMEKNLHNHFGRRFGLALMCEITLLGLLSAADSPQNLIRPGCGPPDAWTVHAGFLSIRVADLFDQVSMHRPLGALYMGAVLRAAYGTAPDMKTKDRILRGIVDIDEAIRGTSIDHDDAQETVARLRDNAKDMNRYLTSGDVQCGYLGFAAFSMIV